MKAYSRFIAAAGAVALILVIAVALAASWAAPGGMASASTNAQGENTSVKTSQITVRGSGSISAKPDTLRMDVGVSLQESTVKAAQTKVSAVMDAIEARLKAAGIDEKDYRTSQYTVEPVMDYSNSDKGMQAPPKLVGIRITNLLQITVKDPSKATDLLDALVTAGANTIYNVSYTFADPDALAKQAYDQAVKDAEAKATRLADLSGLKLGRILNVTDGTANSPVPTYYDKSAGMGGGAGITPGQQSVGVDVVITYEASK